MFKKNEYLKVDYRMFFNATCFRKKIWVKIVHKMRFIHACIKIRPA